MHILTKFIILSFAVGALFPKEVTASNSSWVPGVVNYVSGDAEQSAINLGLISLNEDGDFTLGWPAFGGTGYVYTLEYYHQDLGLWQTLYSGTSNSYHNTLSLPAGSYQVRLNCQTMPGCPQDHVVLLEQPLVITSSPEPVSALTRVKSLRIKEDMTLFSLFNDTSHVFPSCVDIASRHLWAVSLKTYEGRAMYANLVAAMVAKSPVRLISKAQCLENSAIEQPKALWLGALPES